MVCGNFLRTRLPEGTLISPLPALSIFPSVFVKPARLKMKVAAKAVEIWPIIKQVIKHYEGLGPSKRPRNNKS